MKFNDGFWALKAGVKPYFGLQVAKAEQTDAGLALQVSTCPLRSRGDTLKGPVFSLNVTSPTEGVVGVSIEHFSGKRDASTPAIPLFPDVPATPKFDIVKAEDGSSHSISSGGLTAVVTANPFTITFKSPERTLTTSGSKYIALYDVPYKWTLTRASTTSMLATDLGSNPNPGTPPEQVRFLNAELDIPPGQLVYGFGEQFGAFVKNGQTIKIWNQDGGTSSDQAYKNVPFFITNRGYGVFINHPGEVEVEVGSEKISRVGMSIASSQLEYFIIYGKTPLEILERYTRMTGRPAVLPQWTFGLWLSTSFLTSYDSDTVAGFLQGMQDRKCDVRVFHLDCFWMKQYEWCSFTFDPDNFPDPKKYLSEIKQKFGVKICVWINPYISQLSPIFQEAADAGYFIKRTDGSVWQWDLWQPGLAIVDFTNPAAAKWYNEKLSALIDLGVDSFKTDFGERIPHANVVFHNGTNAMNIHNMFAVIYNKYVFDLLKERLGEGEAVLFARTAFAGGQRFPVHWGGDCESTFEAMAEATRGCLSLTASGFGFASHDIGGFEGHPPPEIYQRWVAFGLFSSHSRLHGSSSYRVPWNYGEDAAKNMSKFLNAKHMLMPYLYQLAIESNLTGAPVQRAMFIEFPEDRTAHHLDQQFMLGPSLLVAPVFVPLGEETEYYLPAGTWTYYWDEGRKVTGPAWIKEHVPLEEIPLWIKGGSVLVTGPSGIGRPDYDYGKDVTVKAYGIEEGKEVIVKVPADKKLEPAALLKVKTEGGKVSVTVSEGSCQYTVQA
ncbi:glycoside hydrolase family 31 protein [Cylindrobasidium torrendii FP15055 ss-10]|uniref:alpha-D-xyloside xylohydrolase n=1 Tax=Cylindrobasidium torrendii FP15055 ss-10 TaxID=1314674 RepID=A0A0D7BHC9_9AGAR|nr:glycoside hydrolase family 31 protein [Cylindrobasidium torrendii FP15055 ss-10]